MTISKIIFLTDDGPLEDHLGYCFSDLSDLKPTLEASAIAFVPKQHASRLVELQHSWQ